VGVSQALPPFIAIWPKNYESPAYVRYSLAQASSFSRDVAVAVGFQCN